MLFFMTYITALVNRKFQMKLKTSAQKIQEIFTKNKLEFQVIELSHSTRTAQDAANALSCEIAQIVKSLIFYENLSKNPILILASGINKVSEKIIEKEIGAKISKADAQFVRQVTGFAIGGVPPLGHIQKIISIMSFLIGRIFGLQQGLLMLSLN